MSAAKKAKTERDHPLEQPTEVIGTHALKQRSYELTGNPRVPDSAPGSYVKMTCTRANLRAVGWKEADFKKPVITVGVPYTNIMPCNDRFLELAQILCKVIEDEGGKPLMACTPAISDGETQGALGMRYSLISRDYIADSIEIMHEGYAADAMITLGGCDKTVPGALMPIARLNHTGLSLFGGPALPGHYEGAKKGLDPGSVMEGIGSYAAGMIDVEELHKLECNSLPGSGTCSAMFTACTMASMVEAIGMALPNTASPPAVTERGAGTPVNPQKVADCEATVKALFAMMRAGIKPRDIMTKPAFENCIAVLFALGGSTNAVLHLLAIAQVGVWAGGRHQGARSPHLPTVTRRYVAVTWPLRGRYVGCRRRRCRSPSATSTGSARRCLSSPTSRRTGRTTCPTCTPTAGCRA